MRFGSTLADSLVPLILHCRSCVPFSIFRSLVSDPLSSISAGLVVRLRLKSGVCSVAVSRVLGESLADSSDSLSNFLIRNESVSRMSRMSRMSR